jgi:hypothetical protein
VVVNTAVSAVQEDVPPEFRESIDRQWREIAQAARESTSKTHMDDSTDQVNITSGSLQEGSTQGSFQDSTQGILQDSTSSHSRDNSNQVRSSTDGTTTQWNSPTVGITNPGLGPRSMKGYLFAEQEPMKVAIMLAEQACKATGSVYPVFDRGLQATLNLRAVERDMGSWTGLCQEWEIRNVDTYHGSILANIQHFPHS